MDYSAFKLPKRGDSSDECADAFAVHPNLGRFAVADGATESVFAKSWAQWLVDRFVEAADGDPDQWVAQLSSVQEDWTAQYRGRELPWYAEAKMQHGAFATFLGVAVTTSEETPGQWRAIAVGDTCLFHTRGAELLRAFPTEESQQFGNRPSLVGSKTPADEIRDERAENAHGSGLPGDRLWMMTDALAQWCLAEHEAGKNPWREMERFLAPPPNQESFALWIEELRNANHLRNDDVALVAVSF